MKYKNISLSIKSKLTNEYWLFPLNNERMFDKNSMIISLSISSYLATLNIFAKNTTKSFLRTL